MEVANEEMSEYELISVGGISEFIFLTFNLRKVNVRRGKVLYLCMVRNSKPKRNGACGGWVVNREKG